MKQAERLERIEKLVKLVELYGVKRANGALKGGEVGRYKAYLEELSRLQRVERGFNSIFEFGQTYFSTQPPCDLIRQETPSPEFHRELCDLLRETAMAVETAKMAVAAPRSHAKSVWDTNIFPVWLACYKEDVPTDPYWLIVGDDIGSARKQLDVVKMAFERNELLISDFGNMVGKVWNAFEIELSCGVKFEAVGMMQGIRGTRWGSYRPSMIFDDIETQDSCATPERIAKTIDMFDRTFMPAGDPRRSKYILVGTIISYGSLLNQVMTRRGDWRKVKYRAVITMPTNMHLWERWAQVRKDFTQGETPEESTQIAHRRAHEFYLANQDAMLEGSIVLWPERMSLYDLMVIRDTNRHAWLSEFQNEPLDDETRLFKKFHFYNIDEVNLADLEMGYALDPSLGKNKRADFSAIIVGGRHRRSGIIYILEADIRRRSPDRTILDLFEKHRHYKFKYGWVEGVAFQEFMRTEIQRRSAEAQLYVPADEFKTNNTNKDVRIAGIEPMVSNGYVRFLPNFVELLSQLEYFPKHDRRDGPDCLSMLVDGFRSGAKSIVWGRL